MTIGAIIGCIAIAVIGLGVVGFGIYLICEDYKISGSITIAVTITICAALIVGIAWYAHNTEGGKRAYKDQQSNFDGGITRTVRVYDMEGDLIDQYSGKFDVETSSSYVLFDDENGKRHMIYYTTGTVFVDEK